MRADIVGFTHMSSALKPSLVLGMLQEYFTKLDVLLGMTKCFKYQTVST